MSKHTVLQWRESMRLTTIKSVVSLTSCVILDPWYLTSWLRSFCHLQPGQSMRNLLNCFLQKEHTFCLPPDETCWHLVTEKLQYHSHAIAHGETFDIKRAELAHKLIFMMSALVKACDYFYTTSPLLFIWNLPAPHEYYVTTHINFILFLDTTLLNNLSK